METGTDSQTNKQTGTDRHVDRNGFGFGLEHSRVEQRLYIEKMVRKRIMRKKEQNR
jgi:hypothetical protein